MRLLHRQPLEPANFAGLSGSESALGFQYPPAVQFLAIQDGSGRAWSCIWHVKKSPPQKLAHLTGKPAELAVRATQYSSFPGDNVLDLFGGSGLTLIVCQQTRRRAFLMELDAAYCDTIADRFQRHTGLPAVLERTSDSAIPLKGEGGGYAVNARRKGLANID